jgi:hypothetical protein
MKKLINHSLILLFFMATVRFYLFLGMANRPESYQAYKILSYEVLDDHFPIWEMLSVNQFSGFSFAFSAVFYQ